MVEIVASSNSVNILLKTFIVSIVAASNSVNILLKTFFVDYDVKEKKIGVAFYLSIIIV